MGAVSDRERTGHRIADGFGSYSRWKRYCRDGVVGAVSDRERPGHRIADGFGSYRGWKRYCRTAATRDEAIVRACDGIALIVADYHLAGGDDGLSVSAEVRRGAGRKIPILVLTAVPRTTWASASKPWATSACSSPSSPPCFGH